ncbi:Endoribonuclease Dicer [Cichlidogyrus casuarinus]|uniref:Endoribonuclease Dicer n=1 Tax=Cichlidogyrus casuarinus TaxID=1844966 RepID=A0ABD2QH65_9PLAT
MLEKSHIIVITGGLFIQILNHCKIPLEYISQIIIDECHHASPDSASDFRDICAVLADYFPMPKFQSDYSNGPKILGLTASVVNNITHESDVAKEANALEKIMRSRLITSDDPSLLNQSGIVEEKIIPFKELSGSSCSMSDPYYNMFKIIKCGIDYLERYFGSSNDIFDLEQFLENGEVNEILIIECLKTIELKTQNVKQALKTINTIQEEFGPMMTYLALKFLMADFDKKICKYHVATSETNNVIRAMVYALGQMKAAMSSFEETHRTITSQLSWKPPGYVSKFFDNSEVIEVNISENVIPRQNNRVEPVLSREQMVAWGTWLKAEFPYSDKMEKLLFVLGNSKTRIELDGEDFCALVLTKSRMMSLILAEFLNLLARSPAPNYGTLKAKHCISANSQGKTVQMSQSEQTVVLSEFKDNNFNVMVATNVLEEGLDVRRCNVVCKTDPVTEFRSYVQSKGRARSKNSYYFILCRSEEVNRTSGEIANFQRINRSLDAFMLKKMKDGDYSIPICTPGEYSTGAYLPNGFKGPRISPSSSGCLIMR